jgi:hypothetical protein
MRADRMPGTNAQTGKAANIQRAAPVLLALLAEHKERVAATSPPSDTSPAVTLVGPRGDLERRAS